MCRDYFKSKILVTIACFYSPSIKTSPKNVLYTISINIHACQILAYINYAENSVPERQQERFEKAVGSYQQYVQIFPRGENRERAEDYYDRALTGLSRVSTVTAER